MSVAAEKSLLAQLGIAAEDVKFLGRAPTPSSSVAHGLAGPLPPMRDLSENFKEVPIEWEEPVRLPFPLMRHLLEPGVVRVEDAPAPRALVGLAEVVKDLVLLDGRAGRESGCAIEVSGELFLVRVGSEGVDVSWWAPPPDWAPLPDRFEVPPPSLAELLADRACAAWLRERAEALATSPAIVEQAAAVGVVVRLWEPSAAEGAAILAGDAPDPATRAAAWVAMLSDSRRSLAHLALERAASLREAFDALSSRDDDPRDDEVLALLHERDVLESVRVLLSFAGEGLSVARALALTDDVAATTWSAIAPSAWLRDDPTLRAVFLLEPDSFWGQLAEV
ncbi:MAG: hypothetical protein R3B70_29425 [Polyangiaceae bacterium]